MKSYCKLLLRFKNTVLSFLKFFETTSSSPPRQSTVLFDLFENCGSNVSKHAYF